MRPRLTGFAIFVTALAALHLSGAVAQPSPSGYLQPGALDLLQILPPAPRTGDARDKADRAIFRSTQKALIGTPRWALATNDVKLTPADLMRDFSCSVGVTLTPANAPLTAHLAARVGVDTYRATSAAKIYYGRKRPFLIDKGRTCQAADELRGSADYPSGHATLGWTWATLVAQLAPDRATPILARGRAYGESRIVCGVHNASAVEAGRLSASAVLAADEGSPEFQADLSAARAEIDVLRRSPLRRAPSDCDREAALVKQRVL